MQLNNGKSKDVLKFINIRIVIPRVRYITVNYIMFSLHIKLIKLDVYVNLQIFLEDEKVFFKST